MKKLLRERWRAWRTWKNSGAYWRVVYFESGRITHPLSKREARSLAKIFGGRIEKHPVGWARKANAQAVRDAAEET